LANVLFGHALLIRLKDTSIVLRLFPMVAGNSCEPMGGRGSHSGNWISVFEVPCIIMMWCCKMGIEVYGVRAQSLKAPLSI